MAMSDSQDKIRQIVEGDRNQVISHVSGGMVVYGQVFLSSGDRESVEPDDETRDLGPNPYKGLLAFQERDSDRYVDE